MKKALSYLSAIGEILISIAVFFFFISSFAYLVDGMVMQNVENLRLGHLLLWAPAVLFFGVLTLSLLSFFRGISRFGKLLDSESIKNKVQLRLGIILIVWIIIAVLVWFFGIKK